MNKVEKNNNGGLVEWQDTCLLRRGSEKSDRGSIPLTSDLKIEYQYGCNNISNYILNNGKYCCKGNYQSCPAVIKRVSNSLRGKSKRKTSLNFRLCPKCSREFPNVGSLVNHLKVCKGAEIYSEIRKLYKENERLDILRKKYGRKIVQYAIKGIKRNFSDVMKRAHKEGRSCSWSKKRSYAEKLFEKFLYNNGFNKNKDYFTEYRFFLFRADFYFPDKKLVIEIDGQQHFRYNHQMEIDERKNTYLSERGIDVIRITWKELHHDAIRFFSILKKGLQSDRLCRNTLFNEVKGIKMIQASLIEKKVKKKVIKWGRRKIYIKRKRLMPVNENRVIGIVKTVKS